MPEKSRKRKLRSDQSSSQENVEVSSQASDENTCLTDQDFSDISNKSENRLSKRLRDTEFSQREILRLIENLASKVDNLSNLILNFFSEVFQNLPRVPFNFFFIFCNQLEFHKAQRVPFYNFEP